MKLIIKCYDDTIYTKDTDYESVKKLEYLDMFIKEVLRFYPIGNR
jgi:hypothetical protein